MSLSKTAQVPQLWHHNLLIFYESIMNSRRIALHSSFLLAMTFAALTAHASGTATATMTNTVTIASSCTVSTTGFTSAYDPIVTNATTALTTTASISTTCTLGSVPVVTIGQGANPASGSTNAAPVRRLSNGAPTPVYLNYGLYQDTGRSINWGNTPLTGVTGVGLGLAVPLTVYASVPAGQTSASFGTYTDQVVVTVTF
jgi:spore coat protein U-like protein